jgi:deazaflavin-dependent oxidoreductase (nitroreductase family)
MSNAKGNPATGAARATGAAGAVRTDAKSGVPLKRRVQARVMNTANIGMRRVLGLPVATPLGGRLMLAYIVGRKSGKLYKQPLSYVRDGDDVLLTPGGGKWKYNLAPAKPVRLRIRGRDQQATPELVRDQAQVTRLLVVMAAGNPAASKFIALPKRADGSPEPAALAGAIEHGFCIVRWHLVTDAEGPATDAGASSR